MDQPSSYVSILATGSYLPNHIVSNDDLSKKVDTSDAWITERTGIRQRRIATNEKNSDLATAAAKKTLQRANIAASAVDVIIVATITPDTLTPATACYVQNNLGAKQAIAFDISAACSGYLYAIQLGKSMINSGSANYVLVIGSEKLSSFVNWEDRNTCVLFGDGAGAALLGKSTSPQRHIVDINLGTDGSQTGILNIPGGGSNHPAMTTKDGSNSYPYLQMDGRSVFKIAVQSMSDAIVNMVSQHQISMEQVAKIIPHQANLRIIDAIEKRLKVPREKIFHNLEYYGNTSAAAIAIALDENLSQQQPQSGEYVIGVVFGAGLTWGCILLQW